MEEIKNEQTTLLAQPAEAEKEEGVENGLVSLGKFKDVGALLNAYNSLQSEFTKRCQKIKELEGKLGASDKTEVPPVQTESATTSQENTTFFDKEKILKDYLLDVLGKKPSAIIMDGAGASVKTPVNRPKTIEEAGNLAKNLLNKR
ncbi:MAG: hypothetical protein J6V71_00600 [Clostridia bacterium]|nr:hypothetical protein [Clostridia bacterium]